MAFVAVEGAGDDRVGLRKPPPSPGWKVLLMTIDFLIVDNIPRSGLESGQLVSGA